MDLRKPLTLVVIVVMLFAMIPGQDFLGPACAQTNPQRFVSVPVKVVFVGIDPSTVDLNYLSWPANLPIYTAGQVLNPPPGGNLTGVFYNVSYTFTFASNDFKTKLESYLQSIQVAKREPNPWFYYYTLEPNGYVNASNYYQLNAVTYDANKVENWIYNNQNDVGGFPTNGWTLMFMNLPELPSYSFKDYRDFLINQRNAPPNGTAHYYSVPYSDLDLGYTLRYRDFMTGWGASHRLWYNDFSAGPSFWTSSEDIPLQIALQDNKIDLKSPYGRTWLTQYLADYISQATWNFVTPFFVYTPTYSENYNIDVHIFDNRTSGEKQAVDIRSTVNPDRIKSAFQDLLPYASTSVSLKFEDLSKYLGLGKVIQSNYKYTDSFTFGVSGQPLQYGIVDARPVYKYILDNLQTFEPNYQRSRSTFTIPVFAFAFSKDTLFTFTFKWMIAQPESDIKALLGVALGDLVLISLSQQEFQRGNYIVPVQPGKGEGFTEVVIHESGHVVGLQHPHNFGPIGDFIRSVMGYYTLDYTFGQIDKDALRRAHVDEIYLGVESLIQQISAKDPIGAYNLHAQLKAVDSRYSQMDYAGALAAVLNVEQQAESTLHSSFANIVLPAAYLVAGAAVGFIIAWVLVKRKPEAGNVQLSRTTTTQTAAASRFCANCGKPAAPQTMYCHYCGARLSQ